LATRIDILRLIAARHSRRPARILPVLDALFRRLAVPAQPDEIRTVEDRIWDIWMHHAHRAAAETLDRATRDIAAKRYDIAETRLTALLRAAPDYAEAWHKRATLYYILGRDEECLSDIARTLELEPRHFVAMLHFGEIMLGIGAPGEARFAFFAALSLHPSLDRAREALSDNP
jgi:tetratricopeptide (TPR) repeat protein